MLLGGKALAFYEYEGDVNSLLDGVRASLNELAQGWSSEQKERCLKETADAFTVREGGGCRGGGEAWAPPAASAQLSVCLAQVWNKGVRD
jgi:hypothetical protein